jgi:hypothetical protein
MALDCHDTSVKSLISFTKNHSWRIVVKVSIIKKIERRIEDLSIWVREGSEGI